MGLCVSEKGRQALYLLALFCCIALFLNGCILTKIVTVPMRVAGALVSIIPVAGDTAHEAIDEAAETVDDLPF